MFGTTSDSVNKRGRRAGIAAAVAVGLLTVLVGSGAAVGSARAVPASSPADNAVIDHSAPKALANCTGNITVTFTPGLTESAQTVTAKVTADTSRCTDSGGGATSVDGVGDTVTVTGKCSSAKITNAADTVEAMEAAGPVHTAVTWSGALNATAGVANVHATGKIGSGDDAGGSVVADGAGTYSLGICKSAPGLTELKLEGTLVVN